MIVDRNVVELIIYLLSKGAIDSSVASRIAAELIDGIGWERLEVAEIKDGEIMHMVSIIEDVAVFDNDFEALKEAVIR